MNLLSKLYSIIHKPETQVQYQNRLKSLGVKLGANCRIFSNIAGPEAYLISLGNNVTVATGVRLITHDNSISKPLPEFSDLFGRITIEDNCFIGAYSIILCGVTIGKNSIIGAGSLVVKSVPSGEIWGGVPAKKIGLVKDFANKNYNYGICTRGMSYEEKKELLLKSGRLLQK